MTFSVSSDKDLSNDTFFTPKFDILFFAYFFAASFLIPTSAINFIITRRKKYKTSERNIF